MDKTHSNVKNITLGMTPSPAQLSMVDRQPNSSTEGALLNKTTFRTTFIACIAVHFSCVIQLFVQQLLDCKNAFVLILHANYKSVLVL